MKRSLLPLVALTFQNTALAIMLNYSFRDEAKPYAPSTAVLWTEVLKLITCILVVSKTNFREVIVAARHIFERRLLFLPALLYVVQSNLLFFSSERLPPVIYIVCTQTKIFTSALFSRMLLGTKLAFSQQVCLVLLVVGIVLVQAQDFDIGEHVGSGLRAAGFVAVMLASLSSGLAGSILEKIYKDPGISSEGFNHNVWTRNIQLSLISIPVALSGVYFQGDVQGTLVSGYDHVVWSVIILQAVGGLLTALVLKLTNAVLKCVAISMSICCCAIYSVLTDQLLLTPKLFAGLLIANASVVGFSLAQMKNQSSGSVISRYSSDNKFSSHL
jgi:UDP-sugar transporter A1/2/3